VWDPWIARDIKPVAQFTQKVDAPGFGVEVVSGAASDYFITFDEPPGSVYDYLNGERLYDGLFLPRAFSRFWVLFPGAVQAQQLVLRIHQTPNLAITRSLNSGSDFHTGRLLIPVSTAVVGAGITVVLCGIGSALGGTDQGPVFGAGVGQQYRSALNFLSGVLVSTGAFRVDVVAYPGVSTGLTPEPIAQRASVVGSAYAQSANLESGWTIFGGGGLVGPCPIPACLWQLWFTNTTGAPTTTNGAICAKSRY
jgi:hypothetical protein